MKTEKRISISSLLKKNISKGQLIGYSVANLVGLTVILAGILFFCDSRHHQKSQDKFFSEDYIVVSKKVTGINLDPVAFTEEEISDLENQPWVKKLGKFTSADFSVSASVNMGGKGMSTYLFFEAVPDEFFDVKPFNWDFDPQSNYVPIILNKDYLALYNFGFAFPQGLPQLSEEMIGTVPLKLAIHGKNGRSAIFDASVVGFSSRLNTIAVPQHFIDWANSEFGSYSNNEVLPSRLIIKIDRLNSSDSEEYLKQHGIEISGDKDSASKVAEFMGVVSGVIEATGVVIATLALFIIILSISLLIQKSRQLIHYLILLGYSPSEIAKFYYRLVIWLNLSVAFIAVGLTFISRLIWQASLISLGLGNGNVLPMIGAAIVYFLIITIINISVIRSHVYSMWR